MIIIRNLTMRFGRAVAVNDLSLDIRAGDAIALWGSNGAGKTTLIRCLLGLLRFKGTVEVGGFDVRRNGKQARRLIGYVPQELGFHDDLPVCEAIRFFARLKGVSIGSVAQVLAGVHLDGQERKRIRDLSGGMKQRLALALALLGDPPVLVLDEVTASLDACGRDEFLALLHRLSGSGRTLLFASHRVDEVTTLAQSVVTLDRGRLVDRRPSSTFTPASGAHAMLHLHMPASQRSIAVLALQTAGFEPRLNGVGILVPVTQSQKAAPFRLLAEARVSIDDFELVATMSAPAKLSESPLRTESQP